MRTVTGEIERGGKKREGGIEHRYPSSEYILIPFLHPSNSQILRSLLAVLPTAALSPLLPPLSASSSAPSTISRRAKERRKEEQKLEEETMEEAESSGPRRKSWKDACRPRGGGGRTRIRSR